MQECRILFEEVEEDDEIVFFRRVKKTCAIRRPHPCIVLGGCPL